jgi:hypothetical protein
MSTDEEAEREFREYLEERYSPEVAQNAQMRPIRIKHGKHKKAWVKNVVGIGLAFGFLEPLESTGLMTTHENIILLCDALARRNRFISKMDVDSYNWTTDNMIESMKNFISIHYTLSQRQDNKYWQDCTETVSYDLDHTAPVSTINAFNDINGLLNGSQNSFYIDASIEGLVYVAAGMGYRPINEFLWKERVEHEHKYRLDILEDIHHKWNEDLKIMLRWSEDQPTHYEYLLENIYGTDEFI